MTEIDRISGDVVDVVRQQPINIELEGRRFDAAFKIDLIVEGTLIVGIESVDRLAGVRAKQLLTLPTTDGAARWAADKRRRRDAERGTQAHRQQRHSLCASAPRRKPLTSRLFYLEPWQCSTSQA